MLASCSLTLVFFDVFSRCRNQSSSHCCQLGVGRCNLLMATERPLWPMGKSSEDLAMFNQHQGFCWPFQVHKLEVLYHIWWILLGIFPLMISNTHISSLPLQPRDVQRKFQLSKNVSPIAPASFGPKKEGLGFGRCSLVWPQCDYMKNEHMEAYIILYFGLFWWHVAVEISWVVKFFRFAPKEMPDYRVM